MALTWGEGLNKPQSFFFQRCLQTGFIFLSRAPRSFLLEKNEKRNITTSVYRLTFTVLQGLLWILFHKNVLVVLKPLDLVRI